MHISISDKVMTFPEQTENNVSEFAHNYVKVIPETELTEVGKCSWSARMSLSDSGKVAKLQTGS